ncbi:MAG: methionine--tRNA ligase, partial [Planctomycetota bacterium]
RTLRMCGDDVLAVCGSDDHGVAITIAAEQAGEQYADYVANWNAHMRRTFDALDIRYDVVSGTSTCPEHVATSQEFFSELLANGYLVERQTEQLYCVHDQMFLADRYVEGTCYVCGYDSARGDECPNCGTWIDPLEFEDPRCKICGNTPERRTTTHWYLDLPALRDEAIGDWIREHPWKANVSNFIRNLLDDVPERAITRDMSWGVPLPPEVGPKGEGKVLYVWFDAPIGYISFTKELMRERGTPDAWKDWWKSDETSLVHFIGKDNIPFHCLVFPSMLYGTKDGYILPAEVPANEFYNLKGGKFSTSGGNAFDVVEFVQRYDVDTTRFYICSTMPETSDSEFSLEQLVQTANTSLAGAIGNLATRVLKFIAKNFDGVVPALADEHASEMDRILLEECGAIEDPAEHVRAFRFRRGAEAVVANASVANVFVDRLAPWALRKEDPVRAASALNTLCEWLSWQARWMAPFMPTKAQDLWEMLGQSTRVADEPWPGRPEAGAWRSLEAGQPLGEPSALFPRIELPAEVS